MTCSASQSGGKLKNLSFEQVSAITLNIGRCNCRVLISWALKRTTQNLQNLKFFILRGESPEELSRINGQGILATELPEYLDVTTNLIDFHKQYYYQVEAVEFADDEEVQVFRSDVVLLEGVTDTVQNYIIDEHLFLFRYTAAGVPVMIFKRRRDGQQCPECWDSVLSRVTKSNCRTCFGTGKLEGYYAPIEAWMGIEPNPEQAQVQMWGKLQPNQTTFRFTNYPAIRIGDLVVELRSNDLWKVTQVQYPERNRVRTLQNGVLDGINRSDIEYRLEVPEARRRELIALHDAAIKGDTP